jgi:hypothetical protein
MITAEVPKGRMVEKLGLIMTICGQRLRLVGFGLIIWDRATLVRLETMRIPSTEPCSLLPVRPVRDLVLCRFSRGLVDVWRTGRTDSPLSFTRCGQGTPAFDVPLNLLRVGLQLWLTDASSVRATMGLSAAG